MPKKERWKLAGFEIVKAKVYKETKSRFKMYLKAKKITEQQFIENAINKVLNE